MLLHWLIISLSPVSCQHKVREGGRPDQVPDIVEAALSGEE